AALSLPYAAFELVKALKETIKVPVHYHTHTTTGVGPIVLVKAIEAGADGVDTAISPLSMGSSHTPTESLVETLAGTPYDTGLDMKLLLEIAKYFREIRPTYKEFLSSFTGAD